MYRTYDYRCTECGYRQIFLTDKGQQPDTIKCAECSGVSSLTFGAPAVLRASFPDGTDRGERWNLAKETAKLEQQAARARKKGNHQERKELLTEASKVGKLSLTKRDKTDK